MTVCCQRIKKPGAWPGFPERLEHERLLAGGGQSVYGRITIEVRRERVAFGTGRDDAHKGLVVNFAQGASGQQGRIERSAHLLTVHRFHRPAKGRGHLQQVGRSANVCGAIVSGRVNERGIEEDGIPFQERQLYVVFFKYREAFRLMDRQIAGKILLRVRQKKRWTAFKRHIHMCHCTLQSEKR